MTAALEAALLGRRCCTSAAAAPAGASPSPEEESLAAHWVAGGSPTPTPASVHTPPQSSYWTRGTSGVSSHAAVRRRSWDLSSASLALFGRWSGSGTTVQSEGGSRAAAHIGTRPESSGTSGAEAETEEAGRLRAAGLLGAGLAADVAEFSLQLEVCNVRLKCKVLHSSTFFPS